MDKLLVFSTLAVLMCALVAPSTGDSASTNKIFQDAVEKCKLELNINEVDAQILQNNKQLPANEAQSCYIDCIAKKIGHIKDGKLNHENFINYNKNRFDNDKEKVDEAEKLFQKCQREVEKRINEKCGAGFGMRSCVIEFFNRHCKYEQIKFKMQEVLAYILMFLSGTLYCGFDTVVKEKAFENSNNSSKGIFDVKCEINECLGKTLKLYEDGKMIKDGFLTAAKVFSGIDSTAIDSVKKELDRCFPEVNRKLNVVPKCSKFEIGMKLLQICVDTNGLNNVMQKYQSASNSIHV